MIASGVMYLGVECRHRLYAQYSASRFSDFAEFQLRRGLAATYYVFTLFKSDSGLSVLDKMALPESTNATQGKGTCRGARRWLRHDQVLRELSLQRQGVPWAVSVGTGGQET